MPETPDPKYAYELPEEYFFEADRLITAGDINPAQRLLRELLNRFPDFGKAWNHLGFIYETKYRDPAQAEEYYHNCLNISPDYPAVYLNYAVLLSTQQRFDELEKLLGRALECKGMNKAKVFSEYGIMAESKSEFDSAIDYYRQAVRSCFIEAELLSYESSIKRVIEKQRLLN